MRVALTGYPRAGRVPGGVTPRFRKRSGRSTGAQCALRVRARVQQPPQASGILVRTSCLGLPSSGSFLSLARMRPFPLGHNRAELTHFSTIPHGATYYIAKSCDIGQQTPHCAYEVRVNRWAAKSQPGGKLPPPFPGVLARPFRRGPSHSAWSAMTRRGGNGRILCGGVGR